MGKPSSGKVVSVATVIAIVAEIAGIIAPQLPPFWTYILLGIVCFSMALVAVIHFWTQRGNEIRRASLRDELKEAKIVLNDSLGPILMDAGYISLTHDPAVRERLAKNVISGAIDMCKDILDGERIRVSHWEIESGLGVQKRMVCKGYRGRSDQPSTTFRSGKGINSAWLKELEKGQPIKFNNLDEQRPSWWESDKERPYKSFIAMPVWRGSELHGMVSADYLSPSNFTDADENTIRLIAILIGVGVSAIPIAPEQFSSEVMNMPEQVPL